ncbi:MAG TPA: class I SAM-dependent methyltransferase [Phycisphaerae bacterium]|nr:class I SAM-dependent methyltransferase [Phycisphaerae bacterium]
MSGRGERSCVRLPRLGARLYDRLGQTRATGMQVRQIARYLVSRIPRGRLLDIGTGPGHLLREVHRLNPKLQLCGLDVSGAMVRLARRNLQGIRADLREGTIRRTTYPSDTFALVTCTGSLYLWDDPRACLEEVFRILEGGHSAYLFETHRGLQRDELQRALGANLRGESLLSRLLSRRFLKQQLRMTYPRQELDAILQRSPFADSYWINEVTLAGLPIWLRITLTKPRHPAPTDGRPTAPPAQRLVPGRARRPASATVR